MKYRNLLQVVASAGGLAVLSGLFAVAGAETIAVDNGIAVKPSDIATPSRGMTMNEVSNKFGAPTAKIPAVGNPPITRWEYPGFVVYFEHDYVIHSVVADS